MAWDDIQSIIDQYRASSVSWWAQYQVDSRSDPTKIVSGLRMDQSELGLSDEQKASTTQKSGVFSEHQYSTAPCQYWIKGLPGVCENWSSSNRCGASIDDNGNWPTGYGHEGECDGLGRRDYCSQYKSTGDNLEEYACVAPSIERCGIGKQRKNVGYVSYVPYKREEIAGYNEGDKGIGKCDGSGMGRGAKYYGLSLDEKYAALPICKHYRPWIMGFGALKPRPIRTDTRGNIYVPSTLAELHDGSKYDPLTPMYTQVPFNYQIYTLRGRFQKCGYWKDDVGAEWVLDWTGNWPTLEMRDQYGDPADASDMCQCPDENGCYPYKTLSDEWVTGLPEMMQYSWAEAGTVVCNGAKPECPCYTGKWNYVIDDKMQGGMRITANQILELRFWAQQWESQADYEAAFKLKPGPTRGNYADPSTDVIFTFDRWDKVFSQNPNDRIMHGHSSKLYVATGADVGYSFDPLFNVQLNALEYPTADEYGTVLEKGNQSYPTLIREPSGQGFDQFQLPKFEVVYPADVFAGDMEAVDGTTSTEALAASTDNDLSTVVHNVVWMDRTPGVAIIGGGAKDCPIYAVNVSKVTSAVSNDTISATDREAAISSQILKYFDEYSSKGRIPTDEWRVFDNLVTEWLEITRKNTQRYYVESRTDEEDGSFAFGPLEVRHSGPHTVVILIEYGANAYDFKVRDVYCSFWGAWIEQNSFTSAMPEKEGGGPEDEDEEEEKFINTTPYFFSPPAEVELSVKSLQGQIKQDDVFPIVSTPVFSTMGQGLVTSYYITEISTDLTDNEYWTQLTSSPSYIWTAIDFVDLNLLHEAKIDKVCFTLRQEDEENNEDNEVNKCLNDYLMTKGGEIELEIIYPDAYKPDYDGETFLEREHSHPQYVLLRTPLVTQTFTDDEGNEYEVTQRLMGNFSKEDWSLDFKIRYQEMQFLKGEKPEDEPEGPDYEPGEDETQPGEGDDGLAPDPGDDPEFAPPPEEGDDEEGPEGKIVWPKEGTNYRLIASPIWLEPGAEIGEYKIESWTTHSAAVFGYNSDGAGRKWAAAATKLVGQMNTLGCRNVDIFYSYKAPAKMYDLQPSTGFITWVGAPTVTPRSGGDASGGASGGAGDSPGTGDHDPGGGGDGDTLIDVAGQNALDMSDDIYDAPGYYDTNSKSHYRRPKCGDHDCNPGNCIGPMWYPFNNCDNVDFYNVHIGPAACVAPLNAEAPGGGSSPEFRYCVADQFQASVSPGGNWASSCGAEWYYHYSEADMGGMQFSGYARERGRIFKKDYDLAGWAYPPFGWTGRQYVERWMTRDWTSHLELIGNQWRTTFEFMPYVLDKVDLLAYLNCFEEYEPDSPVQEPFIHSSALSWMSLSAFSGGGGSESVGGEDSRLRFDQAIQRVWHGNSMYPYPLWQSTFGYRVVRYAFNNESTSWIWRERWRDLERAGSTSEKTTLGSNRFPWLKLIYPQYYMDIYKEEHRLVTNEGSNEMLYSGPLPTQDEKNDAREKGEAPPDMKYPSIKLGGDGYERFFNILYNKSEYNSGSHVEWKDEGTQGAASESGGDYLPDEETADKVEEEAQQEIEGEEGEDSGDRGSGAIYENANNPEGQTGKWIHDFDTLFDEESSEEPSEERRAVVGLDLDGNPVYGYYNRGVIANIAKNRLLWLPMDLIIGGEPTQGRDPDGGNEISGCNVWTYYTESPPNWTWTEDNLTLEKDQSVNEQDSLANPTPYKIYIRGQWGYKIDKQTNTPVYYCLPRYEVSEDYGSIQTNTNIGIPSDFQQATEGEIVAKGYGESGQVMFQQADENQRTTSKLENYEIEITMNTWPYRMLSKTSRLVLTLFPIGEDNIAICSGPELINTSYSDTALENVKIWERKYLPGTISTEGSGGNPDGPMTREFRTYDLNMRNAGQYYPAGRNGSPVGSFKDKMVIINAGDFKDHNQSVDLGVSSLSQLKEIEANKQRELYEAAYALDNDDYTLYMKQSPPQIEQFLASINVLWHRPSGEVPFISDKIPWDMHGMEAAFVGDLDFWQPAGHYFQWGDTGTSTRCYIFGTIRDVYSAYFVHAHSDSKVKAMTPGHAYNGWARKEYYEGKLATGQPLQGGDTFKGVDLMIGGKGTIKNR